MRYNRLGQTDLSVSVVSLGTAPLGGVFGSFDELEGMSVVHHALELGINFFDSSPYYGLGAAERRLGMALKGRRDEVIIGTKAGRYGDNEFDFTPQRIRKSVHASLIALQTDYVDILQLHDIDYGDLDVIFDDGYAELLSLKSEGKCRYIGMTAYPLKTLARAVTETELDVVLSYAHHTLLNQELADHLLPLCDGRGVGVINAAAVSLGLLTQTGPTIDVLAGADIQFAAQRARDICGRRDVDIAFLANQFSIQRSIAATTLIGTVKPDHLQSAVDAADTSIDEKLLAEVLAATRDVHNTSWITGRPENNGPVP
jgi:L-galactose dehydrogenase